MLRIRVHGRGGEGAVTFAHVLCASATYDGNFGQSCMSPAIERRGAPVEAYARIGDRKVAERGAILNPDIVVLLNPTLTTAVNIEAGMNDNGRIVANSQKDLGFSHESVYIDASSIAQRILKLPITNTTMLGAFAAATDLVTLDSLEKGVRLILARFSEQKLNLNIEAIRAGYEEVKRGQSVH
ncbi:MAG: 2-oxoacid:acceptor oxidoreductase family protein [Dehalococcoidia bacterium]|nr:MAG: 2-oxoacid:acceptor oxidoreductase family protein [Dehalococcoidia bacterium]